MNQPTSSLASPLLRRLCMKWTRGNVADAEDLLGDAYLRMIEASGREAWPEHPISVWTTVINNLGRDRARRGRRWRFEESGDEGLGKIVLSAAHSAEELYLAREQLAQTEVGLGRMNAKQRRAVMLRSRGVDYTAIAAVIGTSVPMARKLVSAARGALTCSRARRRNVRLLAPAKGSRGHS